MLRKQPMSFGSIDKIGSVPDKSFEKPSLLDNLKDKPSHGEADKDSAKFTQLLDKSSDNADKQSIQNTDTAKSSSQIGDKILNGIQGIKSNIDSQNSKVNDLLSNSDAMSMKDMLKTQKAMSNLTLTQELIGKVAGKSTQIFETMLKQQ